MTIQIACLLHAFSVPGNSPNYVYTRYCVFGRRILLLLLFLLLYAVNNEQEGPQTNMRLLFLYLVVLIPTLGPTSELSTVGFIIRRVYV